MKLFADRESLLRIVWPAAALLLVLLLNGLFTPGFFSIDVRDGHLFGGLVGVFDQAAPLILVSIGMALVIATGGVDLSVGAVMAISGAVAAGVVAQPEWSVLAGVPFAGAAWAAIGFAMLASLAAGVGNGLLVAGLRLQPIIATLVLMVAGRGIAQLLTEGQIVTFQNDGLAWIGGGYLLGVPAPIVIAAAALIAFLALIRLTALGLFIEAIGDNPAAARYVGVRSGAIKVFCYAACGGLAGVAGLIAAADIRAADANNAGLYIELDAILAVVIGGTALTGGRFSILGAVIGALLIQSVDTTLISQNVPDQAGMVVKALVVVAVCLLQSPKFRAIVTPARREGT